MQQLVLEPMPRWQHFIFTWLWKGSKKEPGKLCPYDKTPSDPPLPPFALFFTHNFSFENEPLVRETHLVPSFGCPRMVLCGPEC